LDTEKISKKRAKNKKNPGDIFFPLKVFKKTGKFPAIKLISHSNLHTVIRAHSGHFPIKKCELTAIQKPWDTGTLRALFP
jgi:hypothetical protein